MNNLELMSVEVRISSLDLVELINKLREEEGRKPKRHADFMESIRTELETLENAGIVVPERNISLGSYTDKQNQERPCYLMDKYWIMQMANKESALVRYKTQEYIKSLEQALYDLKWRQGDKKHQLECMELLHDLLPIEAQEEQISYIKANTVVNKCTSNYYGFPKMLKKKEMNKQMLETREQILDDYIKLFEILGDNAQVKDALYRKYTFKVLEGGH